MKRGFHYHISLIVLAFGSVTLASCQSELSQVSPVVQAGNTAGAIVAGVLDPAIAIPAAAVSGALNAGWQSAVPAPLPPVKPAKVKKAKVAS
jgi:hypothetical protein